MYGMYNKLFTKILDSSIWLAPDPHRLVWITLVAAMDEDSIAHFACAENLASRARVSLPDTEDALAAFQSPDPHGPDQEFEGRRLERVPGGWLLLNGQKYRNAVNRSIMLQQNRERVRRFRERKAGNVTVMHHKQEQEQDHKQDHKNSLSRRSATNGAVDEPISDIFDHWKRIWDHPNAKLDDKRQKLIDRALKLGYAADTIKSSMSGYRNSPHHCGQNDRQTVYDDIGLFLRDAAHIDAGLRFHKQPVGNSLSPLTNKNLERTENWIPPEARRGHS